MNELRPGYTRIFEKAYSGIRQGRDVYVNNLQYPLYKNLMDKHQKNFYLTSYARGIACLNASPYSGHSLNGMGTLRGLIEDGFALEYILDNGDVLIEKLHINEKFQRQNSKNTGIFDVLLENHDWKTDNSQKGSIDYEHTWPNQLAQKPDNHYVALAGVFPDNKVAGRRLIDHILNAYKKELTPSAAEKDGNHYSLMWIQQNEHGAQNSVDMLTSSLEQCIAAKAPVSWLFHGESAQTLQRSLEVLKYQPSLSRYAASDEEANRHRAMERGCQQFYLSNPVGGNVKKIERLCQELGFSFSAESVNLNPRNLKSGESFTWNTCEKVATTAATVVTAGVGGAAMKTSGLSAVESAAKTVIETVTNAGGSTSGVLVAGAAAIVLASKSKAAFTKLQGGWRAINAIGHSTFGDGNQFWYEDDKDLLEKLS